MHDCMMDHDLGDKDIVFDKSHKSYIADGLGIGIFATLQKFDIIIKESKEIQMLLSTLKSV